MKIALISDACDPPANGVSRTLSQIVLWLGRLGHEVNVISPERFLTVPCPTQPDIRLAVAPGRRVRRILDAFRPDAIHLVTEGPLGLAVRAYCVRRGIPFTTMFTTRFPEAINRRLGIPAAPLYATLRWFHRPSAALMVVTKSLRDELSERGFRNIIAWSRGVDTDLFRPGPKDFLALPRPIHLYVGRIAPEKSIEDFLELPLDGTKLVVGDGPLLPHLRQRYPDVRFVGVKRGEDLVRHYAASDVFVFPSRTETFGLVVLEALACGLPVAAYPVTGPRDIIGDSGVGVLDDDLGTAVRQALAIDPRRCRAFAETFRWEECVRQFVDHLRPIAWRADGAGMPRMEEARNKSA